MIEATTPVLALRGVSRTYRGAVPVHALREIDLDIRAGELVGVVGPSGSGKSTLLAIMGALDTPTAGTVEVEGRDMTRLPDRARAGLRATRLGFVFQHFHLDERRSALDNVADGSLYQGVATRERRARASALLEAVGLAERRRHRAALLSGGERQRVAIARALMGDPAVVLADEPTGNLDSRTGSEVIALLRELAAQGRTIVVITHDPVIAASFHRTVELADGRIVADSALPLEVAS